MICVIQRVTQAAVRVDDRVVGEIGAGMLVLACVHATDVEDDWTWTARKLTSLRIFAQGEKNFELDVKQSGGSILLVSNFTLAGETAKGRRPSLSAAAGPEKGKEGFERLLAAVRAEIPGMQCGQFGADMKVALLNDGPVTFIIDSRQK
jgi:D-tyrosyl-tRNA(Tyr) deacylase